MEELKIEFGTPDSTYINYNILQVPVIYNGEPSKYKAIIKNGNLLAILGENYTVLPNEEAMEAGELVAKSLNAQHFKRYYSDNEARLYDTYILPKKYRIDPKDTVQAGFTIMNGIDGTLAFSVTGFTFREMCSNGVMMGYKKLARLYRKHTSGFKFDKTMLVSYVDRIVNDTLDVIESYKKLTQINLNMEIAQKLAKARLLPKKALPDYIEIEEGKVVSIDPEVTLWQTYNDITEAIWHSAANMDSKRVEFNVLHRIIQI